MKPSMKSMSSCTLRLTTSIGTHVSPCFIPQAGFTQCASEACGFLLSLPGLDTRVGKRLVEHLGRRISQSLESNPSLLSGNNVDIPQLPRGYVPSSAQDMPQLPSADGMKKESDRTSSLVPLYPHFDSETYRGETSGLQLLRQASPPEEITSQSMYKSASRSSSTQFPKLMCPQPTRTLPVGFSMSPEISLTIASRSTPMASSLSVASISSIGEDNESHGDSESMAMSPGGMSDGGSSCQSEDMWRPW